MPVTPLPLKARGDEGKELEVLRMILNLIPSNEIQIQIDGDNHTLPYHGCWSSMLLEDDQVGLWSSEDTQASFCLFLLPPAWGKLFVLE